MRHPDLTDARLPQPGQLRQQLVASHSFISGRDGRRSRPHRRDNDHFRGADRTAGTVILMPQRPRHRRRDFVPSEVRTNRRRRE